MQRLEVSGAVRLIYKSLGAKSLNWVDHVNYRAQNALMVLHFVMRVLNKGLLNKKNFSLHFIAMSYS